MPEQSEGNNHTSKINVFPIYLTLLMILTSVKLPKTLEENPLFGVHTKMSVRRFNRDNFAPIVGFHNDEKLAAHTFKFSQRTLPFGSLDGDT